MSASSPAAPPATTSTTRTTTSAIRKRVVARGRVQGVFFRDSARRRAESLGVAGWVTNRDDGAVESVFEGEPDAVESMVRYVREGPGHATVEDVEVADEEPEDLSGFRIT